RLATREGVLAMSQRAVVSDEDRKVCCVPRDDHLERREVNLGQLTTDLIEVAEGLSEGEEVALDPPGRSGPPRSLSGFREMGPITSADFAKVIPAQKSRLSDEDSSPDPANRRKNRRNASDGAGKTRG